MAHPVCPYHGENMTLETKTNAQGVKVSRYVCNSAAADGGYATPWTHEGLAMTTRTMANIANLDQVLALLTQIRDVLNGKKIV